MKTTVIMKRSLYDGIIPMPVTNQPIDAMRLVWDMQSIALQYFQRGMRLSAN